jgi:hypothetical protein
VRALVCGGRDFADARWLWEVLNELQKEAGGALVILHGGAQGADALAGAWARHYGIPCLAYLAEWRRYGRRAGPIRNQRMLDEGSPDLVLAFPGGRGTADLIARAREAGIPVRIAARKEGPHEAH